MDKKRPHYDLASIKATFSTPDGLRLTETSLTFATLELGLSDAGIVLLIQGVERTHFYKSMTSVRDHRIWQDVYHLPFEARLLYVKFTTDETGYLLISLKDK
ncbi:MAG TPA: type II toxin-antitoxin system MqsR family toxin [Polyangiaceae bacterium]|jgi:motility quorum-sensing regulator/GCU-specific mRNA interferase toxin